MNGSFAGAPGAFGLSLGGGEVASLFLVLMRSTGLVVAAPILGHRSVPAPVKAGLAAVLAIALVRNATVAPGALPVLVAAPIELLIGLALGFALSLGFQAIELAGRLLSLQVGFTIGAVLSPTSSEGSSALDPFFAILAGLLFLALDLHLATVRVLATSLAALPIGGGWPADLWLLAARLTTLALELGVRVALPLALVLLLTELAVALLARAIPQVNVFILGLPVKILVGLAVLGMALPGVVTGATAIYRAIFTGVTAGLAR